MPPESAQATGPRLDTAAANRIPAKSGKHAPAPAAGADQPAPPPRVARLSNGTPVIFRRSSLSATASLKVLTSPAAFPTDIRATPNHPLWGVTSLDFDFVPQDLPAVIAHAAGALNSAMPPAPRAEPDTGDPSALLQLYFQDLLGMEALPAGTPGMPLLLVLGGDIDPDQALPALETAFGTLIAAVPGVPGTAATPQKMDIEVRLDRPVAQEQLGYLLRAPAPGNTDVAAWQVTLYLLSHGYEGRLGKEAISQRGLIYYVDSAYHSDGQNGWITLGMGVDPDKLPAMKALLRQELLRLVQEPPSQQEIDEARQHLLGRYLSAAQSNPELTDELARQWLWYGRLIEYEDLQRYLSVIRREDIIRLLPAFVAGTTISIRNPGPQQAPAVQ
jgi:hypothetical protein